MQTMMSFPAFPNVDPQQAQLLGKSVPGLDMSKGMGKFFFDLLRKRVQAVSSFSEFLNALIKCNGLTDSETHPWKILDAEIKNTILLGSEAGVDLRCRPFVLAYARLSDAWGQLIVDRDLPELSRVISETCQACKNGTYKLFEKPTDSDVWVQILCDFFLDLISKLPRIPPSEQQAIVEHLNVLRKLNGFASIIGDRMVEYKRVTDKTKMLAMQQGINPDDKNPDSMMKFGMFTISLLQGNSDINREMEKSFVTPQELEALMKIDHLRPTGSAPPPSQKEQKAPTDFMSMLSQFGPPPSQAQMGGQGLDQLFQSLVPGGSGALPAFPGFPGFAPPPTAFPPGLVPPAFPAGFPMFPPTFPPPFHPTAIPAPTSTPAASPVPVPVPSPAPISAAPITQSAGTSEQKTQPALPLDPSQFLQQLQSIMAMAPQPPAKSAKPKKGKVAQIKAEETVELDVEKMLPRRRLETKPAAKTAPSPAARPDMQTEAKVEPKEDPKPEIKRESLASKVQQYLKQVLEITNVDVSTLSDDEIRSTTPQQWIQKLKDPIACSMLSTYLLNPGPITVEMMALKQMMQALKQMIPPRPMPQAAIVQTEIKSKPAESEKKVEKIEPKSAEIKSKTPAVEPEKKLEKIEPKFEAPTKAAEKIESKKVPTPDQKVKTEVHRIESQTQNPAPMFSFPSAVTKETSMPIHRVDTSEQFSFDSSSSVAEPAPSFQFKWTPEAPKEKEEKETKGVPETFSADDISSRLAALSVAPVEPISASPVLTKPPATKAGAAALERVERMRAESDRPTKKRQTAVPVETLKKESEEEQEEEEKEPEAEAEQPFVFELESNMNFGTH